MSDPQSVNDGNGGKPSANAAVPAPSAPPASTSAAAQAPAAGPMPTVAAKVGAGPAVNAARPTPPAMPAPAAATMAGTIPVPAPKPAPSASVAAVPAPAKPQPGQPAGGVPAPAPQPRQESPGQPAATARVQAQQPPSAKPAATVHAPAPGPAPLPADPLIAAWLVGLRESMAGLHRDRLAKHEEAKARLKALDAASQIRKHADSLEALRALGVPLPAEVEADLATYRAAFPAVGPSAPSDLEINFSSTQLAKDMLELNRLDREIEAETAAIAAMPVLVHPEVPAKPDEALPGEPIRFVKGEPMITLKWTQEAADLHRYLVRLARFTGLDSFADFGVHGDAPSADGVSFAARGLLFYDVIVPAALLRAIEANDLGRAQAALDESGKPFAAFGAADLPALAAQVLINATAWASERRHWDRLQAGIRSEADQIAENGGPMIPLKGNKP